MPTNSTVDFPNYSIVLEAYKQAVEDSQFEEAHVLLEELKEYSHNPDFSILECLKIEQWLFTRNPPIQPLLKDLDLTDI